jgi:formate/nitrite transporter FocA (FNT family)
MSGDLDEREHEEAEERAGVRPHVVHEVIRHEGELELERPASGLAWSALAAGLSMGFSLVGTGVLRTHLPETRWSPLVAHLGYTLGFIFVIVARQQLFTEQTLLAVIPFLSKRDLPTFGKVCRTWAIVLVGNLAGALAFATVMAKVPIFDGETQLSFQHIADEAMRGSAAITFARAIMAGWLIALMVWMLPVAQNAWLGIVALVSYVVAVCGFAHIIAGAIETLFAVVRGTAGLGDWLVRWFLPTLAGNAVGGVALVAAINHAQVVAGNDDKEENRQQLH